MPKRMGKILVKIYPSCGVDFMGINYVKIISNYFMLMSRIMYVMWDFFFFVNLINQIMVNALVEKCKAKLVASLEEMDGDHPWVCSVNWI